MATKGLRFAAASLAAVAVGGAASLDMAITGGTGVYRNARGIARFWGIATPDERVRLEILR
ncbi:hypothetical protein ACPB9E_09095 [Streptomyces exfoliatus]|uniref:hypothetical protein n=1 Tax=Streptomyces exfoliatus TaxID=1905 RepID=UPI003C2F3D7A